ncbi:hypothetical protein GQ600_23966 [Phytophthora cactorum]|nr:hypothetical protein GQ600_23966 [Phytophthora cactorum]
MMSLRPWSCAPLNVLNHASGPLSLDQTRWRFASHNRVWRHPGEQLPVRAGSAMNLTTAEVHKLVHLH